MAQPLLCHGHAGSFPHRRGVGLHCSKECEARHLTDKQIVEEQLKHAGFTQVKEVPNLWERDGVHLSIEEAMREGLDSTLARHQDVVASRV